MLQRADYRGDGAQFLDQEQLGIQLPAARLQFGDVGCRRLMFLEDIGPMCRSHQGLLVFTMAFFVGLDRFVDAGVLSARAGHEELARGSIQTLKDLWDAANASARFEEGGPYVPFAFQECLTTFSQPPVVEPEHGVVLFLAQPAVQQNFDIRRNGRFQGLAPLREISEE